MTAADETPTPPPAAQAVADELALLTILKDRVGEAIEVRRAEVAKWTGGTTVTVELPDPAHPSRPTKIGTVRADGGQGTARVADRAAWTAWCKANASTEVVTTSEGRTAWALDDASRQALLIALDKMVNAIGFGVDRPATFLAALEAAGYTLEPVTVIPATDTVRPAWETETLKLTQKNATPVTPDGQIPAGIEFTEPDATVRPVVTIGKTEMARDAFVQAKRTQLAAIAAGVIGNEEH